MSRTRILMTADAVGGVWQYATSLAKGLRRHDYETVLAVLGPAPSEAAMMEADGLEVVATGLPLDWIDGTADAMREVAQELAALARERRCTLAHVNTPLLAAHGFGIPCVAVAHGCISTWWRAGRGTPIDPAFRWHHAMSAQGLSRCDIAVAPTASFARQIKDAYELQRPIAVVHNGRDAQPPISGSMEAFAFTAGRLWDEAKNIAVLDAAAARLGTPILAAGAKHGPNGERWQASHLHWLGNLPNMDVREILARRPVFVSTARFEPFGLAVLEAAQAGCPLLLSDIPSFRELWDDAAVFVDPDDAAGFADALARLLDDPAARAGRGAQAQARSRRYTVAAMAEAMAVRYTSLLSRSAAA